MARIGTAGWSIPRQVVHRFAAEGSALERYASRFSAVEINSSFHRPHRASTWARWGESVPEDFRFAVKLPKAVTHDARLVDCGEALDRFFAESGELDAKLAVVLVQLPPKLDFVAEVADAFFAELVDRTAAIIACEPRHPSWFAEEPEALLTEHKVCRVAADPAVCPAAARPGGWRGLSYWRLHGSPRMYRSSYSDRIADYAKELHGAEGEAWCIFDNTASSAAAGDALALNEAVTRTSPG